MIRSDSFRDFAIRTILLFKIMNQENPANENDDDDDNDNDNDMR